MENVLNFASNYTFFYVNYTERSQSLVHLYLFYNSNSKDDTFISVIHYKFVGRSNG